MRLLACDYGTKTIGLAYGTLDDNKNPAVIPLSSISVSSWEGVSAKIIITAKQYKVDTILFGNPLNKENQETTTSLEVKKFVRFLTNRLNIPIKLVNERYTTYDAQEYSLGKGASNSIHSQAAALMLLRYLEENPLL
ncbi:MAG: Holliday junction resolvase RuvX [Patescibacteria group bacterium]